MSISAVEDAIRQVRQQLADYPTSGYLYNEATTRNVIINPMLEALGWDLCNLDQCGYEIDPKGELWGKKPADYVLGAPSGRTVVIVEAKRMANGLTTEREEEQLAGYAEGIPVRRCHANQRERLVHIQPPETRGLFGQADQSNQPPRLQCP